MTITLDEPLTQPDVGITVTIDDRPDTDYREPGDHDRFSHYIDRDKSVDAMVFNFPVVALCGKKFVPGRDPNNFSVCPECKRLFDLGPEGRENDPRWQEMHSSE